MPASGRRRCGRGRLRGRPGPQRGYDDLGSVGTSKVKTKLIADSLVKARNVNVDTSNGVVTLRGIVFSSQQEARAILLARETKGVKKVISHLKISR